MATRKLARRSNPRILDTARHRARPGQPVNLRRHDPDGTPAFTGAKEDAKPLLAELNKRLETLQETLWAEGKQRVLVVLQGLDASGKDGVLRRVFEGVNPSGVQVAGFKAPSSEELAHDFLWRVHRRVPRSGQIVIFNRSHYEDVLVVRVRGLAPERTWRPRYAQIQDFERLLVESGTTILKFFLHISREEQKARLEERLSDPAKRWKFRRGDLEDRAHWDDYLDAYREAIQLTSTATAPWWIVPANRNWYRDLVVSSVIVAALERLDPRYPPGEEGLEGLRID